MRRLRPFGIAPSVGHQCVFDAIELPCGPSRTPIWLSGRRPEGPPSFNRFAIPSANLRQLNHEGPVDEVDAGKSRSDLLKSRSDLRPEAGHPAEVRPTDRSAPLDLY
jgi:hypothetical protein